jgi:hypothetical protein
MPPVRAPESSQSRQGDLFSPLCPVHCQNIMSKIISKSLVCAVATLLLVLLAGSAQAASYLHVAFYKDEACASLFYGYVGITSSPRSANQFLDQQNYALYLPGGCPVGAAAGTQLQLLYDGSDVSAYNITLSQCTVGRTLAANVLAQSYSAVCTNSETTPFYDVATFTRNSYANETVCTSQRSSFSAKLIYGSEYCIQQNGVDSLSYVFQYHISFRFVQRLMSCVMLFLFLFFRYTCNSTHVTVKTCTSNIYCLSGCTEDTRPRTRPALPRKFRLIESRH